ncbi:MAG: tail fiber domain-containing protein, partial [Actinomycetota bacterium]
ISTCSSSIRYKTNINSFRPGIALIKQLRPVSFNWKDGGSVDMGLVAEEVNAVEPLLTTTNEKGEVEGVKYDRVGVVLVNAVNEQQTQIEAQQKQIDEQKSLIKQQQEKLDIQQSELEALKKFVCSQNPSAEICKPKF